jgi:hypothetical protein
MEARRLRRSQHMRIILTREHSHRHLLGLHEGDISFHGPLSELLGEVLTRLLCDLSIHLCVIPASAIERYKR